MSKDNQAASGANSGASGSEGNEGYSKEFVEKLTKEKTNAMKDVSELRSKTKELQEQLESLQSQKLQEQNQYKELYEREQKAKLELANKLTAQTEKITNSQKREAVSKELFKHGLDEKFLDDAMRLIDLKTVNVDPETLVIVGAEDAAKGFVEKFKTLGFFKNKTPGVNHTGINPGKFKSNGIGDLDLSKMSQKQKLEALRKLHNKQ